MNHHYKIGSPGSPDKNQIYFDFPVTLTIYPLRGWSAETLLPVTVSLSFFSILLCCLLEET